MGAASRSVCLGRTTVEGRAFKVALDQPLALDMNSADAIVTAVKPSPNGQPPQLLVMVLPIENVWSVELGDSTAYLGAPDDASASDFRVHRVA